MRSRWRVLIKSPPLLFIRRAWELTTTNKLSCYHVLSVLATALGEVECQVVSRATVLALRRSTYRAVAVSFGAWSSKVRG